uniref:Piwi-domain-containing protein n=1 Tax=Rhizophagus irregularis (strain DAOM 181602 / DAOM 197198 / MUCL 43194) TaxID=747089 RepID=U9UWV0_RHIID
METISKTPSELTEFVLRPNLGTSGRHIRVRSNFFEITSLPDMEIIHYDVTITPDVPPILNRKIFAEFEKLNLSGALGNVRCVFDGRKNIFASRQLPIKDSQVSLPNNQNTSGKPLPKCFELKVKKVGKINYEELVLFLGGKRQLTPNCLTAIMALDVIIHHQPSMDYVTVGHSFFTPRDSRPISGGAEIWQGYYQSARPTQGKMMINVDLSATAFYERGPLLLMITKLLGRRTPDDLRRGVSDKDYQKIERSIKNLKIRVTHRGELVSKKNFKISKFTPSSADNTKFDSNGVTMSVSEYFQKTYNRRLNYSFLPCVVVKRNIYLPIEICEVVEGQRHIRKLSEKQTADMIKFTCQQPHERANKIRQGLDILNYRTNEYLRQFGLTVNNDMVVLEARVLSTPTITYHPSSRDFAFQPREGSWNLRDKKVAVGATLGSWAVVCFGSERDSPPQMIQAFIRQLVITCSDTGMDIPNKTPPIIHASPQGDIENILKQAWLRAGNISKAQPQLILCILPNIGVPLYAEIKRVADTVIGVASQCCQNKHMIQAKKQYCANICLKINVKLGGMNSFISPSQVPFITDRPTILMGADVSHPGPGDLNLPSIAALCGSMDSRASRYSASIRVQSGRTDIIADLGNMAKELLKTFYQSCGRKPERILFYRDGVSEGQFSQVLRGEVDALRAACASLEPGYRPTITFVIVQKRHHTIFFPLDKRDADRTGNCLPGTVIESTITHPFEFDFYLQSHPGLQGTSRSTHYHVLYDENSFSSDGIQQLSNNLCYIYARCTRAVSIVPPVYYAHIVCRRARFHSHGDDIEISEGGIGATSTFGVVKPELQRVRPVLENHLIRLQGLCARWRMNLLAISDIDKNIMFVAMNDTIFVHRLNFNGKPSEPFKKLRYSTEPDYTNKSHTINAIKVGKIGNEEVLVSVDEAGDIRIWFTSNLDKNPIQFR